VAAMNGTSRLCDEYGESLNVQDSRLEILPWSRVHSARLSSSAQKHFLFLVDPPCSEATFSFSM